MNKKSLILLGFVLLKFIIQFRLILPVYDLHRDEYLHLDQGHHLAWGYQSVPPVTSWISFVILQLGNGVFWVKFFPALFGALTLVVVWKTIEALGGNLFALILGATAILFSVLLRMNILFQPNSLDILFWTLLYFCIVKYINSEDRKWLYALAVVFAIGFLNKYNIVFLLLGLLPALVLTEQRKIFLTKDFYFAMILALVLISPNLVWQYHNGFPVFHHLGELAKTQLDKVDRAGFIKEQFLFFLGGIFIIIAGFISFFAYAPFNKYRLFFWSYVFTMAIFIYFRAKGYYAIGLYPVFLAFGAVYLGHAIEGRWKIYWRPALIAIPILLFIPFAVIAFPIFTPRKIAEHTDDYRKLGLTRWEDGKDHLLPQDFADMIGWKELAFKTDSAWSLIGKPNETLVLCSNYGQAGAINYYSTNKNIRAVSLNADYINWFPFDRTIKNMIWVREEGDTAQQHSVEARFASHAEFGKITDPYAREVGATIYVLKDAKVDMNAGLKRVIAERKE